MPRGRHRNSQPLHRLLAPVSVAAAALACAGGAWLIGEPGFGDTDTVLLRSVTAAAAVVAGTGAALLYVWDRSAGRLVGELQARQTSTEWRAEERQSELEGELDTAREARAAMQSKVREKRAELGVLRGEHAELLRRYAHAEAERASALEGRRQLELESAGSTRALSATSTDHRQASGAPTPLTYLQANEALRNLSRSLARKQEMEEQEQRERDEQQREEQEQREQAERERKERAEREEREAQERREQQAREEQLRKERSEREQRQQRERREQQEREQREQRDRQEAQERQEQLGRQEQEQAPPSEKPVVDERLLDSDGGGFDFFGTGTGFSGGTAKPRQPRHAKKAPPRAPFRLPEPDEQAPEPLKAPEPRREPQPSSLNSLFTQTGPAEPRTRPATDGWGTPSTSDVDDAYDDEVIAYGPGAQFKGATDDRETQSASAIDDALEDDDMISYGLGTPRTSASSYARSSFMPDPVREQPPAAPKTPVVPEAPAVQETPVVPAAPEPAAPARAAPEKAGRKRLRRKRP